MAVDTKEIQTLVRRWAEKRLDTLSSIEKDAIFRECNSDPSVHPDVGLVLSQERLEGIFERNRETISKWKSGKLLDALDDKYFDGYWVDRCYKHGEYKNYYITNEQSLEQLEGWVKDIEIASRRKPRDQKGRLGKKEVLMAHFLTDDPRGSENVTMGDFETVQVNGLGKCALLYRNRGWVKVFDDKGIQHRLRVLDVPDLETVIGNEPFYPSAESLLSITYRELLHMEIMDE